MKYPLWVGDVQVTSANAEDADGTRGWSFTPAVTEGAQLVTPATLTLNGYSFDGTQSEPQYGIRYEGEAELAIALEGDSSVEGTNRGVLSSNYGSVSITGDGSLTAVGLHAGVEVYGGDLTIDGDVAATGATAGIKANYSGDRGNVTIAGGEVTATATAEDADAGIYAAGQGSVTIDAGTVTAEGRNGIKSDDGTVTATASGENSSGISSVLGTTISGALSPPAVTKRP